MPRLVLVTLLAIAACGRGPMIWNIWPVTPDIAAKSTFPLTGTAPDGSKFEGQAFLVNETQLVTSQDNCMGDVDKLYVNVYGRQRVASIVALGDGLCVVKTADKLGDALLVADRMPYIGGSMSATTAPKLVATGYTVGSSTAIGMRLRNGQQTASWQPGMSGAPVYDGCGVTGVMAGPRLNGFPGSRIVTVGVLQRFLTANGVAFETQPAPPESIDLGGHPWGGGDIMAMRKPGAAPVEILPVPIPHGGSGSCR